MEKEEEIYDQGKGKERVVHASFFHQMGYGPEQQMVRDFASSLKTQVRKVESVVSLMLLVRMEDFFGSWRHGESEGVGVLESVEMVISKPAFYDGQGGRPRGRKEVRYVLKQQREAFGH